jgi:large subunit ribosomal protein L22
MEVRSIHRYARISAFKAREVTREIQGLPVSAALDVLAFTPKKAAILVNQTLKSAIANAENNANLKADGLVVKEAVVGEGPTFKRMKTRARGSGSQILKRTSHIRIVLTDEKPEKEQAAAEKKTEDKSAATEKKPRKTKKTAKAAAKK